MELPWALHDQMQSSWNFRSLSDGWPCPASPIKATGPGERGEEGPGQQLRGELDSKLHKAGFYLIHHILMMPSRVASP